MLTKRTALIKAKKFLAECKELPLKIDRAILFGSMAKGGATQNSDIDLALFSKEFSDNIFSNLDLIGSVNIHYPDIDAHTYPSEYLKTKKNFINEIKRTGIEIPVS